MQIFNFQCGSTLREKIELHAVRCGKDWNIVICGGEKYHIGAVALAMGNPIEGYNLLHQPAVGQLVVPDHKDYIIASDAALQISKKFKCQVCVSAGIHIKDAGKEDVQILESNVKAVLNDFISMFRQDKQQKI